MSELVACYKKIKSVAVIMSRKMYVLYASHDVRYQVVIINVHGEFLIEENYWKSTDLELGIQTFFLQTY